MTNKRGESSQRLRGRGLVHGLVIAGITLAGVVMASAVPAARSTVARSFSASATVTGPNGAVYTIPSGPALSLSMAASTSDVVVGTSFTVTTTVTDTDQTFSNVAVVFSGLGGDLSAQSVGSTAGSCSAAQPGTYDCSLGVLTPGNQVDVAFTLLATAPGSFTLSAQSSVNGITNSILAPSPATSISVTATAPPAPALWVHVPSSTVAVRVGGRQRIGIVVGNSGSLSTETSLSVALPAETRLVSAVPKTGACSRTPVVCSLGDLGPQVADLVVLTVRGTKPGTGQITLAATGGATGGSVPPPAGSITLLVSIKRSSARDSD